MPEYPDVTIYIEALAQRIRDTALIEYHLASPFLLRTVEPPLDRFVGKRVVGLSRLGKRIVFEFEGDIYWVIHLMIAGRFKWKNLGTKVPGKIGLASFSFPRGCLIMTEASSRKRASLHAVSGKLGLDRFRRDGLEVFEASCEQFTERLRSRRHTIKRALTDPDIVSGVGNAYSDEILHRARLSPFKRTDQMTDSECQTLYDATKQVLGEWVERLRKDINAGFPEKVTAFRPEMVVHGKFDQPCPICGARIQRIRYASNEANYCATCQTGGRLLADRSLSRLLKQDWPKTIEELENRRRQSD